MRRIKKKIIRLTMNLTVVYDSEKAMRSVVSDIKRHLFMEFSTAGDGWATARTGRVTELKKDQP